MQLLSRFRSDRNEISDSIFHSCRRFKTKSRFNSFSIFSHPDPGVTADGATSHSAGEAKMFINRNCFLCRLQGEEDFYCVATLSVVIHNGLEKFSTVANGKEEEEEEE